MSKMKEDAIKNIAEVLTRLRCLGVYMENVIRNPNKLELYISVPEHSEVNIGSEDNINKLLQTPEGLIITSKQIFIKSLADIVFGLFGLSSVVSQHSIDTLTRKIKVFAKVRKGETWKQSDFQRECIRVNCVMNNIDNIVEYIENRHNKED